MKTDQLIQMLSTQAGPAPQAWAMRRVLLAALAGLAASAGAAVGVIGWVSANTLQQPGWWLKLGYAVSLAAGATWWTMRQGQPGAPTRRAVGLVLGLVIAMQALGLLSAWQSLPELRLASLLGHSWQSCPRNVILLSLPALAAAFWALRGLAPTRPRRAGAAAGLLAGAVGAAGYALSCNEVSTSFVAAWYTLGIFGSAAIGALLGPRLLNW